MPGPIIDYRDVTPGPKLNGNLLDDGTLHYAWDEENRLVAVEPKTPDAGSRKVEYAYDGLSRRTEKRTYNWLLVEWVLDETVTFAYDDWNMVTEVVTTLLGATTNRYEWGLDLSLTLQGAGGVGGLLMAELDGEPFYPAYDGNGNITEYTDGSTAVVAHYAYDLFGNLITETGARAEDFVYRFSTKYHEAENGLLYYGYRYLAPDLGRWLNRDPIGEVGGIHLYGYVNNRPYNLIDPHGLTPCPTCEDLLRDCIEEAFSDLTACTVKNAVSCAAALVLCALIPEPITKALCLATAATLCSLGQDVCNLEFETAVFVCNQQHQCEH